MSAATPACTLVAVVLVWDGSTTVDPCVLSLLNASARPHIIVVDNGSRTIGDDLRRRFPQVQHLRLPTNVGVAGGRNAGLSAALALNPEFIATVDDDATVDTHALSFLIDQLRCDPALGAVVPKVRASNAPSRLWRAGCTSWTWGYALTAGTAIRRIARITSTALPRWLDHARGAGAIDHGQFDQPGDIAFAFGGASVARADALRATGPLDESLAPYGGEDIDHGLRMRAAGWRIGYVPKAVFHHPLPGRNHTTHLFFNNRHMLLLARRHLSAAALWGIVVPDYLLLQLPARAIAGLAAGSKTEFTDAWNALTWNLQDMHERGIRPPIVADLTGVQRSNVNNS
jgi:GT2 family glycosyltransferase